MNLRIATLTFIAALASSQAMAGPGHNDDHGHKDADFAAGKPGDAQAVDRKIQVQASDQMSFNPEDWTIRPGETVKFVVTNIDQLPHEFVIDTRQGNAEHREAMMAAMADGEAMMHEDPNALMLAPGETGELVWTFTKQGTFEAACNIPGHYQAGMKATIDVDQG